MKYILLILALVFATPVFAQSSDQNAAQELNVELAKMTDAEKAEALKSIRAGKSETAAKAREWVEIGNALGEGMAATAERMGVVANDFATTPLGKLAMVLIVWNYMGDDLLPIFLGLPILTVMIGLYLYQMRKTYGRYTETGKFIKYDVEAITDGNEGIPALFMTLVTVIISFVLVLIILV